MDQRYLDIFTTALEGGIQYWAAVKAYKWSKPGSTLDMSVEDSADVQGFRAVIMDGDDGKEYVIDRATIRAGLNALHSGACTFGGQAWPNARKVYARFMSEDYDAGDADNLIQVALFGDVRYG